MTLLYGNLADAALGDLRFGARMQERLKSHVASPAVRLLAGVLLVAIGLASLVVLNDAPDRFSQAMPAIADLERWLVWGDAQPY